VSNDTWATPQTIYNALDSEFDFCADMAASEDNAKHRIFWAETDSPNSLEMDWSDDVIAATGGTWVWCNPPYSNITPWVDKAIEAQKGGLGTVMLVMADPSVGWFAKAANHATEIRFVTEGRLAFLENGKPKSGNNKGSVFFIFAPKLIGNAKVTFVTRKELIDKGSVKLEDAA